MRRMRHLKPREIQGCDVAYQFWRPETLYDATSGGALVGSGGTIARADDVSGNGNHATQASLGDRPTRQVAAQNGMDAATFDGVSDYLSAGDVADMLSNPVECYAVLIRTGASGLKGIMGKSRAAASAGLWSLLHGAIAGEDNFYFSGSGITAVSPGIATSTSLQVLYGHTPRGNTTVDVSRNSDAPDSMALTDTGASQNTANLLFIGAYQSSTGTGLAANSFIGGDILECAKYSVSLTSETRRRVKDAAMRRARITG